MAETLLKHQDYCSKITITKAEFAEALALNTAKAKTNNTKKAKKTKMPAGDAQGRQDDIVIIDMRDVDMPRNEVVVTDEVTDVVTDVMEQVMRRSTRKRKWT